MGRQQTVCWRRGSLQVLLIMIKIHCICYSLILQPPMLTSSFVPDSVAGAFTCNST